MKTTRIFLILLITISLLTSISISSYAAETGFETEEYTKGLEYFVELVDFSKFTEEPEKLPIYCFDVNDDKLIAIGGKIQRNQTHHTVFIYSEDGTFIHGYNFKTPGTYGLEFNGDNLIICFVREMVALEIDSNGVPKSIRTISNTSNSNDHWNEYIWAKKRNFGAYEYYMQTKSDAGDIFGLSNSEYTLLVVENALNRQTVIYEAPDVFSKMEDAAKSRVTPTTFVIVGIVSVVQFIIILIALPTMKKALYPYVKKK